MKLYPWIYSLTLVLALHTPAFAHGDHDASALTGDAPIGTHLDLTPESIANLDIKTAKAERKTLPETLSMPATIALLPERQAQVTTRFDGRIMEIKVKLGDDVEKGQELVVVEPVQLSSKIITYTAPISGRVMQQNVVLGQAVTFQTSLIDIADLRQVLLQGAIYETPDLTRLTVGQKVTAKIGIYPDQTFEGVIQRIDPGPDPESRAFHVYALIDNAAKMLKPNLRGTMTVNLGEDNARPGVVVPAAAILESNGIQFAFVREGNVFERRSVRIGRRSGLEAEITGGISQGEEVVTQGNYQLQYLKPAADDHRHDGRDIKHDHEAKPEPEAKQEHGAEHDHEHEHEHEHEHDHNHDHEKHEGH